jgi:hypothetical protein
MALKIERNISGSALSAGRIRGRAYKNDPGSL